MNVNENSVWGGNPKSTRARLWDVVQDKNRAFKQFIVWLTILGIIFLCIYYFVDNDTSLIIHMLVGVFGFFSLVGAMDSYRSYQSFRDEEVILRHELW